MGRTHNESWASPVSQINVNEDCDYLVYSCMPTCPEVPDGCHPQDDPYNCDGSPIMLSFQGRDFALSSAAAGVNFDVDHDGVAEQTAWTSAGSHVGILVTGTDPRSGADLWGNHTYGGAGNGFAALSLRDVNHDGRIDQADPIYGQLGLWFDGSGGHPRDGVAQSGEIVSLTDLGIVSISLRDHENDIARDQYGNRPRQISRAYVRVGRGVVVVPAVDWWLVRE